MPPLLIVIARNAKFWALPKLGCDPALNRAQSRKNYAHDLTTCRIEMTKYDKTHYYNIDSIYRN